jgi:hypothetical protein
MDDTMKKSFDTKILLGYGFLFILAVILRLHHLQFPLLSEHEASIALQATGTTFTVPGAAGIGTFLQPLFFVFGQSEVSARILPALFGIVLIFLPFLFQGILGKEAAAILSVLIMFDPGLIAFSRQVDGAIISVFGLLFAIGFVINQRPILASISAGLALLGSPIIWPGIAAMGFAFWWMQEKRRSDSASSSNPGVMPVLEKSALLQGLSALLMTILLLGSAFGTRVSGIAAPLINLMDYFKGWALTNELSPFLMLFSFLLYQPFVLVIGLIQGFRSIRSGNPLDSFLLRWFFISLLLAIVYPSRGMDSLLLSFFPLMVLAARFMVGVIHNLEKPDIPAYGQMVLFILLIPFSWMNFIVLKFPIEGQETILRLVAAVGALVLLLIASILIRMGWPAKQASTGVWIGTVVLLAVFTFSTAWRAAGLGLFPEAELWNYAGVTDEMDLLQSTAGDLSEWNVASRDGINIVLLNNSSPAVKWSLRNFTSVHEDTSIPNLSNPAVIITNVDESPSLAEAYRGQDFIVTKRTAWSLILPEEWIKWYAFRTVPNEKLRVILWARTDLFPGASKTAPATITPIQ